MDKYKSLKEKLEQETLEVDELDKRIAKELKKLEELNEKRLEVKMRRIAMEEIFNDSRERLLRSMGEEASFHGFKDMEEIDCMIRLHRSGFVLDGTLGIGYEFAPGLER